MFMNERLSSEKQQIWKELVEVAEGIGRVKELKLLNEQQKKIIVRLKSKGFVAMSELSYIVIAAPQQPYYRSHPSP
jgi:hypothetical protein